MEHIGIAKIAVAAAPYSIDRPYDYLIPERLSAQIAPGIRVVVPFGRGNRRSEGVVLALGQAEKRAALKAVSSVLDEDPVLHEAGIALAFFLRQRYFCTMYEAVRAVLPAGLWYRLRETCRFAQGLQRSEADAASADLPGASAILDYLDSHGGAGRTETLAACGAQSASALKELLRRGILVSEAEAQRRLSDRTRQVVRLAVDADLALEEADRRQRAAPLRSEALRFLAEAGQSYAADVCYFTGASVRTLRNLEKAGFVSFSEEELLRVPPAQYPEMSAPARLNVEQTAAFERILALLEVEKPAAALLEGVTGSGKTEIYIRLVQEVLRQKRTAMVLVPEIVLTPQIMQKFSSCFGDRVVMLHSGLKLTERYDQWKRIRRGEVDVVLGTRSAIFSPLKKLGLIVLDEEQEDSYRSENPPRYNTREVAKFRCGQDGAVLVLGSATPSVESAWAARQGTYQYNCLRQRYNQRPLPEVTVADMRQELRAGNSGSIGTFLRGELEKNIARGEQSILFLNRRGNSRMLLCGECGLTPQCPRCSVPMTYHSANGRLMCHYCGHSERAYERCPACGGYMKRVGIGTQKAEAELAALFPGTQILRMDADTTSCGHEALLQKFENEKIPILLGTQMIARGLDFENVTLVGVLAADQSLYVDSYLAPERTFSLLTQVVGRAGRGGKQGRAVIQTYTPDHSVIRSAAAQDYDGFYADEIRMRRIRRYPPFSDLFRFTVSGGDEEAVVRGALRLRDELKIRFSAPELRPDEPEILGPAPAPVVRVNNRFRYRVLVVGKNSRVQRELISGMLRDFAKNGENRALHVFVECNAPD